MTAPRGPNLERDELIAFTVIIVALIIIVGILIDRDHVHDLMDVGPLVLSAIAVLASYVRLRSHRQSTNDDDDPPSLPLAQARWGLGYIQRRYGVEGGRTTMALANYSPARIAKALMGGFGAAAAAYTEAIADNSVTSAEWVKIIGAFLIAGILVWVIPNKPPVESGTPASTSGTSSTAGSDATSPSPSGNMSAGPTVNIVASFPDQALPPSRWTVGY